MSLPMSLYVALIYEAGGFGAARELLGLTDFGTLERVRAEADRRARAASPHAVALIVPVVEVVQPCRHQNTTTSCTGCGVVLPPSGVDTTA